MCTVLPSFCFRNTSADVKILHITLIEPTIQHLLIAQKLSKEHQVIIIDTHAEIGTPSFQIGWCKEATSFKGLLTQQEIDFLQILPSPEGYGFRIEWLIKHLVRKCVSLGVDVFSRSTILHSKKNNGKVELKLQSPNNLPGSIETDIVVVDCSVERKSPGNINHNIDKEHVKEIGRTNLSSWYGVLLPSKHLIEQDDTRTILHRGDGCSEIWTTDPTLHSPYAMEQWHLRIDETLSNAQFENIQHLAEKSLSEIIETT